MDIRLGAYEVQGLVDSGSEVTLVEESVADVGHPEWRKWVQAADKMGQLVSVSGDPILCLGIVSFPVVLGKFTCQITARVVKGCNSQMILGMDFLKAWDCVIDLAANYLSIGSHWQVPFADIPRPVLKTAEKTLIPPEGVMQVMCRVVSQVPVNSVEGILLPDVSTVLPLVVPPSLLRLNEFGQTHVLLANTSDNAVTLNVNTLLGELAEAKTVCTIDISEGLLEQPSCAADEADLDWFSSLEIAPELSEEEQRQVKELLWRYRGAMSNKDSDIGETDVIRHPIDTGDHPPIRSAPYRMNPIKQGLVRKEIEKLEQCGVIIPSSSEWSSPVVLVKKKDDGWRLCIDYRKLNAVTKTPSFPLPKIDEIFDAVGGNEYFCCLDLNQAYHQVKLKPEDASKTAFSISEGLWEFTRMPFGLSGAPATYQLLMNTVLRGLIPHAAIPYLDDVIIFGKSFKDTLENLELVLKRFSQCGLKIKPRKCKFFAKEIEFLGHVVSTEGLKTDPKKTQAVRDWPRPKNPKELKSFLGFINYYRRFLMGFSEKTGLLRQLEHDKAWEWTENHEAAFAELKQALVSAPILAYPDFSENASPFILDCDASDKAVGGVLSQEQEGTERVIAFASKPLTKERASYCATQKEMYSLVHFVEYFREYLLPKPFIIRTDHNALRWLRKARNSTNDMLIRWNAQLDVYSFDLDTDVLSRIQEYNFQVLYRPGKYHGNADGLSRIPFQTAGHHDCPSCHPDAAVEAGYLTPPVESLLRSRAKELLLSTQQKWEQRKRKGTTGKQKVPDIIPNPGLQEIAAVSVQDRQSVTTRSESAQTDSVHNQEAGYEATDSEASQESRAPLNSPMDIGRDQENDPDLIPVIRALSEGTGKPNKDELHTYSVVTRRIWAQWENLYLRDGVLMRRSKDFRQIVVPWRHRNFVLRGCHDNSGHGGMLQSRLRAKKLFWWPNITKDIERHVRTCLTCSKVKGPHRRGKAPLQPLPKAFPNQAVHLDLAGPLTPSRKGNVYMVVIVDRFTSWIEVVPIANKTATAVAEAFVKAWVCRFGVPDQLYTDQGHEVAGQLMKTVCRLLGVEKIRTTPFHPQADGKAERAIQQLKRGIRLAAAEYDVDWEEQLPYVLMNVRSAISSSSGFTPAFLTYGRELVMPHESLHAIPSHTPLDINDFSRQLLEDLHTAHEVARTNYQMAQIRQKRNYDASSYAEAIKVGEWVLLRRQREHTLDPFAYDGPFEVQQKLGETQFVLQPACSRDGRQLDPSLSTRRRIVHFDRLFKVRPPYSFRDHFQAHQLCSDGCACRLLPKNLRDTSIQCQLEPMRKTFKLPNVDSPYDLDFLRRHESLPARSRSPSQEWDTYSICVQPGHLGEPQDLSDEETVPCENSDDGVLYDEDSEETDPCEDSDPENVADVDSTEDTVPCVDNSQGSGLPIRLRENTVSVDSAEDTALRVESSQGSEPPIIYGRPSCFRTTVAACYNCRGRCGESVFE